MVLEGEQEMEQGRPVCSDACGVLGEWALTCPHRAHRLEAARALQLPEWVAEWTGPDTELVQAHQEDRERSARAAGLEL